jgi:hypothetical protein
MEEYKGNEPGGNTAGNKEDLEAVKLDPATPGPSEAPWGGYRSTLSDREQKATIVIYRRNEIG